MIKHATPDLPSPESCPHRFTEMVTAALADGMCPLCMAARIERLEADLSEFRSFAARIERKLLAEAEQMRAEIERLQAERDQWNADTRRLSGGLMAIRGAAETVPAAVLRSVAYDIALNCIEPDVAAYQIERRAALAGKEG